MLPPRAGARGERLEMAGDPPVNPSSRKTAHYQMVSVRYFETLGISFLKGRPFTDRDLSTSTPVCIVNEEFVRQNLRGREPIGAVVKVPAIVAGGAPPPLAPEVRGAIKQVAGRGSE